MASDTRERMIRTTSRLLRTQGYSATGLNQIVAEAEAPKGSLYFHFPGGKEELAAAAVERFAATLTERLREGLASAPSVADAIGGFFDDYIAHLDGTSFAEGCAVATVALETGATHPLLGGAVSAALRSWTGDVAAALEAEGHDAASAHRHATLVIAAIEGGIVMAKGERSTEPLVATRDALRGMLRRA